MIGAIIGAVAGIGGALLSSSSQKKAANQAADSQLQVAQQNNALAREFRTENTANFQPNLQSGFQANSLIDSFLYGTPPQQPSAAPQPVGAPQSVMQPQPQPLGIGSQFGGYTAFSPRGVRNLATLQEQAGYTQPEMQSSQAQAPVAAQAVQAPGQAGQPPMSGYDQFVASPYYQNPLQEGFRALNTGLASRGMIESGDAIKRATRYGQDYAYGRMGEYIGLAERQANRGITGASAIAGVGQNALGAMTANNQNAADALSNAALLRGQANNSLYGGIGNALGYLASSYKW